MSDLAAVVSELAKFRKKDLAIRIIDLFKKNMSYLSQFEQVAYCYSILECYDQAIKIMENALPLAPSPQASYTYRSNLANLYIKKGMANRALIYINVNERIQKSKELAYLRLQAEQILEVEKEKKSGVAPTGYWNDVLHGKYHQHSHELANWIADYFDKNKQVYDFGCGWGKYLSDLDKKGFKKLKGYEGVVPSKKYFENIAPQDLTQKFKVGKKGNVICLDVAEHIPEKYVDVFLDNICNACDDKLVMSWAVRGQGGTNHVNCLDNHEAIALVEKKGFKYLVEVTQSARNSIGEFCQWFTNSILIFERTS